MLKTLQSLFARDPDRSFRTRPSVPDGERYYAVGDIHGRDDLFAALADAIDDDAARSPAVEPTVVLLGDLVDRGPSSASVIARARAWSERQTVRCLAGNHEEMFLQGFEDARVLREFIRHGGRETLLSYGMTRETLRNTTIEELQDAMRALVPQDDIDFLRSMEEMIVAGDYLFVHAGIDPYRPIEEQKRSDMLWIRSRFLNHDAPLDHKVVHGHTISENIEVTPHRIGIDTGAFRTGVLTALVLEGTERRILQAIEKDGTVRVAHDEGLT